MTKSQTETNLEWRYTASKLTLSSCAMPRPIWYSPHYTDKQLHKDQTPFESIYPLVEWPVFHFHILHTLSVLQCQVCAAASLDIILWLEAENSFD